MASLGMIWQLLFKGYQELQTDYNLFQHGEMLIIRMIYLYEGPSPDDLIKQIKKDVKISDREKKEINPTTSYQEESTTINKAIEIKKNKNTTIDDKFSNFLSINSFRQFVDIFHQKKEGMLHTYLYNNVKLISFSEGEVIINTGTITDPHFPRIIAKFISKWTGRIWQVSKSSSNIGKTLYEEDLLSQQKEIEIMKNDPEIKEILGKYPEAKIHSITNIVETPNEAFTHKNISHLKED